MNDTNETLVNYHQQGLEIAAASFDTSILAGTKSPNTIEQYKMHFAAYCAFASRYQPTDEDITAEKEPFPRDVRGKVLFPPMLARWRQALYAGGFTATDGTARPYSVGSINQRLAAIRGVMAEAAQQGFITHELAGQFKHVKGLKQKANKDRRKAHSRTAISKQDMNRIVDAPDAATPAGAMHRALLLTLATCGMRISEAVNLRVTDIQFQTSDDKSGWVAFVLGKNMTEPEARPLGKGAKQAIDEWLAVRSGLGVTSEFVFTGFSGRGSRNPSAKPINRGSAWELVQRYAKALDLAHIKPHDFRRYVGTQLAKQDIRLAQKQLGHKRIETTAQHYVLDDVALGVTDNLV